ncbi:hypothetical protein [Nonomuraea lactucae]|uniref:hypothetical protein n=1 Tax=Nonomuraea lactucae TaxID=2249762 RepID=UPI000DE4ECC4|nr:hypothetical protein [Nonomuraea lactucae]
MANRLTPEQSAKIDRASRRVLKATGAISAIVWLLFAAAIWLGDWRLAGLGALTALPALLSVAVYGLMSSDSWRQQQADRLNAPKADE